mmetsp:Transcript_15259/g.50114  ORF Transcript_15259/g.50114 Transcript_15259/m.50114 type:complete len:314 (+) Transcript_15259:28-969(+)
MFARTCLEAATLPVRRSKRARVGPRAGLSDSLGGSRAKSRAARALGLETLADADDLAAVRRAFRRKALQLHPDIAGNGSSEEFQRVHDAYELLTGVREVELGPDAHGQWSEHDWRVGFQYDRMGRSVTREERATVVGAQLSGLKQRAGTVKARKQRRAGQKDYAAMVAAREHAEAMQARAEGDREASAGPPPAEPEPPRVVAGPRAAEHSTPDAHARLTGQLQGLSRAAAVKAKRRPVTHPSTERAERRAAAAQLEENITERFIRLAKLAKEWRESGAAVSYYGLEGMSSSDKLSPRELLQAAVEGVALGACT